jgi:Fe2+ or Zn2+ uptake regulation protein
MLYCRSNHFLKAFGFVRKIHKKNTAKAVSAGTAEIVFLQHLICGNRGQGYHLQKETKIKG